jgi:hypothetical protein
VGCVPPLGGEEEVSRAAALPSLQGSRTAGPGTAAAPVKNREENECEREPTEVVALVSFGPG